MILGHATQEGTARYKSRFVDVRERHASPLLRTHFRDREGLSFSSIGIGSYLGESDEATDRLYEESMKAAVESGINVIDSAINYRSQRSERAFGKAIAELIDEGKAKRDELIVCTKGGFIPFDGEEPADYRGYIKRTYIDSKILRPEDVAQGCHAMTPAYLEDQLSKSLKNLGLETIDIYYLHNPETQLEEVSRKEFLERTRAAFVFLEEKVKEGKIQMYGTATWNGYRIHPEADACLQLEELILLAREVGGTAHHFKAVQLPLNLAMPEAWMMANQRFGANLVPVLNLIDRTNMIGVASASLSQARLTGPLPEFLDPYFDKLPKSSQRAIQFARSIPGITTALVGMKNTAHVAENLLPATVPPLSEGDLVLMFQKS